MNSGKHYIPGSHCYVDQATFARYQIRTMLVLLAFSLLPIVYCDFKLSDSKLLLPYYSVNPVNYTLHGSEGACYEW